MPKGKGLREGAQRYGDSGDHYRRRANSARDQRKINKKEPRRSALIKHHGRKSYESNLETLDREDKSYRAYADKKDAELDKKFGSRAKSHNSKLPMRGRNP